MEPTLKTRLLRFRFPALLAALLCASLATPARAMQTDTDGVVHVSWTASPTPGVVGYHVYRGPSASGPLTRLTATLVTVYTFADDTVLDGETYYYAVSAVDTQGRESDPAPASTGILIAMDVEWPVVLTSAPFDGQGLPADTGADTGRGVPVSSSLFVRLWDDGGVDMDSVSVMVLAGDVPVDGITAVFPLVDADPTDVMVRFLPTDPLPLDAVVHVAVDAADAAGNAMETHAFGFRVQSAAEQAAAAAAAPATTLTELADGAFVLRAEGMEVQFPESESQPITLGPVEALPVPAGDGTPGPAAFLDTIQYYADPVTIRLPLTWDELNSFRTFHVLRHDDDPRLGWQPAAAGDGWLVSQRVVEQMLGPAGGYLELQVRHAAGVTVLMNP